MMPVAVGFFIFLGVIVVGVIVVLMRLLARGPDSEASADDARLAQDMHRTLERLEARVAVLETLLASHSPHAPYQNDDRRNP